MKSFKLYIIGLIAVAFSLEGLNAQMTYGSIEYEIRTNLNKRFPASSAQQGNFGGRGGGRMMQQNKNTTYLTEKAVLYFNDTASVFITEPMESAMDQNRTFISSTVVNFKTKEIVTDINLLGERFKIVDNQSEIVWKFTSKERLIAGKYAKQAITQINDSTIIYAWFDTDVVPSVGPESYWDLPGAILGLAYEDGSVTYFATKINENYPDLAAVKPSFSSKKVYTRTEFENEFIKKYKAGDRLYQLVKDMLQFY